MRVLLLKLTLTSTALADDGIMKTDGAVTQPQPQPTVTGEMHTEVAGGEIHTDGSNALTEVGLRLLQDMLTRF